MAPPFSPTQMTMYFGSSACQHAPFSNILPFSRLLESPFLLLLVSHRPQDVLTQNGGNMVPMASIEEGETVYDVAWYPFMNAQGILPLSHAEPPMHHISPTLSSSLLTSRPLHVLLFILSSGSPCGTL